MCPDHKTAFCVPLPDYKIKKIKSILFHILLTYFPHAIQSEQSSALTVVLHRAVDFMSKITYSKNYVTYYVVVGNFVFEYVIFDIKLLCQKLHIHKKVS